MKYIDDSKREKIPVLFSKDNNLISSKSKMTLRGRKIFDAAIMYAKEGVDEYGSDYIKAELFGNELMDFLGVNTRSVYGEIKKLCNVDARPAGSDSPSLLDWSVIIKDDKKKAFDIIKVIVRARFEDGKLEIYFNTALKSKLIGLKKNFTMLDRNIICNFSSNYSYQLYQIFKQTIDKQKAITKKEGPFDIEFDLVDLKIQLGVVDANVNPILKKAVMDESVKSIEAIDEIQDKELVRKLKEIRNFRRYSIEKATSEINEISDIVCDYHIIRNGQGGACKGVIFTVKYKDKVVETKEDVNNNIIEVDPVDFIDEMNKLMKDEDLSFRDLRSIADAANYDMDKVKKAYEVLCAASEVTNVTAFMIKAIKDNYQLPKKRKKTSSFHNFHQREYSSEDFLDLERSLLNGDNGEVSGDSIDDV
ncbi:MAG: replication initiation protein [Eubacterium sp.]|nr:replication initiation protein [Eubacterium sp.]